MGIKFLLECEKAFPDSKHMLESPKLKESLCYRFEELVSKDRGCLLQMLKFCGFKASDIPAALSGFEAHSQQGHISELSSSKTGERFLSKDQVAHYNNMIRDCGIPDVLPNSIKPQKTTRAAA